MLLLKTSLEILPSQYFRNVFMNSPQVEYITRKSAVLSTSSMDCLSDVSTINLTVGCAHGCLYCYTQGYSSYPGNSVVQVYDSLPQQLENELNRKRRLPSRVYFSPSSDLFQPIDGFADVTRQMLNILLERQIEVAFLTKGRIPDSVWSVLEKRPHLVFAQVGLITTNDAIRQIFEPNAAPVDVRLSQIRRLVDCGVKTTVRLDPILPGLTDSDEEFDRLCQAVSPLVRSIAASVLFLRPIIYRLMKSRLEQSSIPSDLQPQIEEMFSVYSHTERIQIRARNSIIDSAPIELRRSIYERLTQRASKYGLSVHICGCKNPDLSSQRCLIAGTCNKVPASTPTLFSIEDD